MAYLLKNNTLIMPDESEEKMTNVIIRINSSAHTIILGKDGYLPNMKNLRHVIISKNIYSFQIDPKLPKNITDITLTNKIYADINELLKYTSPKGFNIKINSYEVMNIKAIGDSFPNNCKKLKINFDPDKNGNIPLEFIPYVTCISNLPKIQLILNSYQLDRFPWSDIKNLSLDKIGVEYYYTNIDLDIKPLYENNIKVRKIEFYHGKIKNLEYLNKMDSIRSLKISEIDENLKFKYLKTLKLEKYSSKIIENIPRLKKLSLILNQENIKELMETSKVPQKLSTFSFISTNPQDIAAIIDLFTCRIFRNKTVKLSIFHGKKNKDHLERIYNYLTINSVIKKAIIETADTKRIYQYCIPFKFEGFNDMDIYTEL